MDLLPLADHPNGKSESAATSISISAVYLRDSPASTHSPSKSPYEPLLTRARRIPFFLKIENFLRGPSPSAELSIRRWKWTAPAETLADRLDIGRYVGKWKSTLIVVFLAVWLVGFSLLVRESSFFGVVEDQFVSCTSAYWTGRNADCGLNGENCTPFNDTTFRFRCPAKCDSVTLLNPRTIGSTSVNYVPLLVGGGDSQQTYRGDSWICSAAIQQGLFKNSNGGCAIVNTVGTFQEYVGIEKNGLKSESFASQFPSSIRLEKTSQHGCRDLRDQILGFNVALTVIFSLVLRPPPRVFFWVLVCLGFWHISLVSYPSQSPPSITRPISIFLPTLFVAYAIGRFAWRWVLPAFEVVPIERTVWYLGGFWVGALLNETTNWIPIDRLTPHDISQRPGGLVAVIILSIVGFLLVVNQIYFIRKTGWLLYYLKFYVLGILVLGILAALPTLQFRFHHFFAGIVLSPGTAFKTRVSALLQAFLLGMFLNGVARWDFDSIFETAEELRGDAVSGSDVPTFATSSTNFLPDTTLISFLPIPTELQNQWTGYSLLIDDVLRYSGTALNFSLNALSDGFTLNFGLPHYLRLAYSTDDSIGDFTMPATAFIQNGTWIDPLPGST